MWTRGLVRWYSGRGRHELLWRLTGDPWEILLSEVMLQQTQVSRVIPKWEEFRRRWPDPEDFAGAPLDDVLRAWQGLGYPRRALALHRTAAVLAGAGWPADEAGLLALPGVGVYTARALLVLALNRRSRLPRDVNITRVVSRAALGMDAGSAHPRELDAALEAGRPRSMSRRHYVYALFDVGALHCRPRPSCASCPLASSCAARAHGRPATAMARRRPPRYAGSMRELRGRVLATVLSGVSSEDLVTLRRRASGCGAAERPGAVVEALEGLRRDGLLPP